jgi:hypothetical protein
MISTPLLSLFATAGWLAAEGPLAVQGHADCIFTNERGMVFGKAHRVDVTKSRKVVFSSYKVDEVSVRVRSGMDAGHSSPHKKVLPRLLQRHEIRSPLTAMAVPMLRQCRPVPSS